MADHSPGINLDDIDFGPTIRGLQKGDRVFDRFVLQKLLGRGGMGVVWLALDERLRREVALKFAPEVIRYDDVAVEELKEETCKGLVLSHPNIVKTFDFLLDESNAAISMEYIDGESLSAMRIKQPRKVFEVRQIERWVSQLLVALDYAHQQVGMIHRDLKPANLMVDRAGNLKVTDFGIARSITDAMSRATLMDGNSTGTLAYMSPQQAEGRRPQISDDLYAFGSTLYEMLTGKPPFFSGNIALQLRVEAPVSLSQRREEFGLVETEAIPPHWEETLLACLDKDPEKRPASAAEIEKRLTGSPMSVAFTVTVPVKSAAASEEVISESSAADPENVSLPAASSPPALPKVAPPVAEAAKMAPTQPVPFPIGVETAESSRPAQPGDEAALEQDQTVAPDESSLEGVEKTGGSGSGWLWAAIIMIVLGIGAMGAAGWWLYQNTPFFRGKGEVVKEDVSVKPLVAEERKPEPQPTPVDLEPTKSSEDQKKQEVVMAPKDPKPELSQDKADKDSPDPRPTSAMTKVEPDPQPEPPPAKFTTIQNAIKQAKPGSEVIIPEGIYNEQVRLQSGIRLIAASPGKVTIQTDGKSGPALLAEGCKDVSLVGITFQHTGSEVVEGESWPVVFLKGSSVHVENCIIQKGVGDGLIVAGTGKTEIKLSRFVSNAVHGLVLESGSRALVTGCEFLTNGVNGVTVRHTGTAPVLTGCTLTGNGGSGAVVVDGAIATFGKGTVATGNREAGLAAEGEDVLLTVTEAVLEENLQGISVTHSARAEIRKNQIRSSKQAGLIFDHPHGDSIAEGNTIEKNKDFGVYATGAEGGTVKIFNNKVLGNASDGIVVFGAGFKPEVVGNSCLNNAQHGILAAEGCSGVIRDNVLKGNQLGAIATSGVAADIVVGNNQMD